MPVLDVTGGAPFDVAWGRATAEGGRVSMLAVEAAVRLCLSGDADAMVTAPISKEAISLAGHDVPGHTEFIARLCGVAAPLMLLAADFPDAEDGTPRALRVGLVTVHVPLRKVAEGVTEEAILARLATLDAALRQDYGIARPRLAVLGLNPHAGDGGVLGDEEIAVIQPALDRARAGRVACRASTCTGRSPPTASSPPSFLDTTACWPCTTTRASRPSRPSPSTRA